MRGIDVLASRTGSSLPSDASFGGSCCQTNDFKRSVSPYWRSFGATKGRAGTECEKAAVAVKAVSAAGAKQPYGDDRFCRFACACWC